IYRKFPRSYRNPCIAEMGGKNPAIVSASADLDAATDAVLKSAFGLPGQQCSACSRSYVHHSVARQVTALLVAKTDNISIAAAGAGSGRFGGRQGRGWCRKSGAGPYYGAALLREEGRTFMRD